MDIISRGTGPGYNGHTVDLHEYEWKTLVAKQLTTQPVKHEQIS